MGISVTESIHEAIRDHAARTRVEKRDYGFSWGKFGFGYSVEREEVIETKADRGASEQDTRERRDFAKEMLNSMRRRMDAGAAFGSAASSGSGGILPLQVRTALKAYAATMVMAVQPSQPSRLIAVA